jgi:outer membrane protein assembly factor BamA/autotransporter translocation and assembly factor TamB
VALIAAAVHLPVARGAVLGRTSAWLSGRGLSLSAERLDYNLFTLSATLVNPRLGAKESATPFFEADRVRVDLPAAVLRGRLVFDDIELTRPVIRLRNADGVWNLPRGDGAAAGEPPHLQIRRLRVDGLRVDVEAPPVSFNAEGVHIDLGPASEGHLRGALRIAEGLALQVGERRTSAGSLDGTIDFDGRTLTLDPVTVRLDEGQVWLKGRLGPLLRDPSFDMAVEGYVDLARASRWLPDGNSMTGRVWLSGTLEGPAASPTTSLTVAAPRTTFAGTETTALRGQVSLTSRALEIVHVSASVAGGRVTANGRVQFEAAPASANTLEVSWSGVDVQSLLSQTSGYQTPRLASHITGISTIAWRDLTPEGLDLTLDAQLAAARRPNAVPIGGTVHVEGRAGQAWTLAPSLTIADATVEGQFAAPAGSTAFADMALEGPLRVRAPSLHAVLANLHESGIALGDALRTRLDGALDADGRLAGSLSRPQLDIVLSGRNVGIAEFLTPGTLEGRVAIGREAARVTDLIFRSGENTLTGNVVVDLLANGLSGALALEAVNLAATSPVFDPAWQVDGKGRATAVLSGTLSKPLVSTALALTRLVVAGQTLEDVEADARITTDGLELERLTAQNPTAGTLAGSGRLAFDGGAFSVTLAGRDWALANIRSGNAEVPLRGVAALDVAMEGSLDHPRGTASLTTRALAVRNITLGDSRVDVSADGSMLSFTGTVPSLATRLDGTLSPTAPYPFSVGWKSEDLTLAGVFDALTAQLTRPDQLDGVLSAEGRVAGTLESLDASRWNAAIWSLHGTARGLPFALTGNATLAGDASSVQLSPSTLTVGQTTLTLGGRLGAQPDLEGLSATIDGRLDDLSTVLHTWPDLEALMMSGPLSGSLRVAGTLERPSLTGALTVSAARAAWRDLPAASDVAMQVDLRDGVATLSNVRANWQGAQLTATGSLPLTLIEESLPERMRASLGARGRPLALEGTLAGLGPGALEPFLAPDQVAQFKGNVGGRFSVGGRTLALEALTGELILDQASVALVNVPLDQVEPTRLRLASNRVSVDRWLWRGADNQLEVSGGFSLADDKALAMKVRTIFDLRAMRAFVPTLDAGGYLTGAVDIGGTLDTPRATGNAYVTDGMLLVRDPRLSVYGISATVNFAGTRLDIADAYGWANGGLVTITGFANYPNQAEAQANLRISGSEIGLEFPAGVRSLVAPDLRLVWRSNEPAIEGRVNISGGTYRSALNLTTDLLSRTSEAARGAGGDSPLARTRLDIAIVTTDDIAVDNNYARLEVGADLRVGGTIAAPAILGRLAFREGGEIYLGGNTYHLEQGAIDFTNPARIEPDLSLTARTQVGSHSVTLAITGPPGAIRTDLSSDEGYTQDQLLALLVTGQPDSTNLTADIYGEEMLGLLSGELSGFLSRTFGVRGLRVERGLGSTGSEFDLIANDVDPITRLTLSQEFSEYVEVILSQNLRKTGALTWLFIVKPRAHLDLRFTSRDDSTRAVEIRQEFNFGGRTRSAERAGRAAAPRLTVAAVRLAGAPGFAETELVKVLSLKAGADLSFFDWQDDRDRLQRYYESRGYLEARVIATRKPLEGNPTQVDLVYQLTRGPLCELRVDGADFDRKSIERLRARWSATGLDAFLSEDIATAARDVLSDQGYLRAKVEAEVQLPTPDRKILHLRVDAGEHSTRPQVLFVGHDSAERWELEQWMYQQGLYLAPWTDQAAFSEALEGWYRRRGHLASRVRVDPPVFEGDSTTATVRIDEGPRFTIGAVTVAGAQRRPLPDVLADLGVKSSAPYDPVSLEESRTSVIRGYRAQGFNDVRDTMTLAVNADAATVDVALTLDEGRQQVLAEVVFEGQGTTNRGLIARALRLEPGKPVDMNAWQQSRRRLYELGTFRSVRVEPATIDEPTADEPREPQSTDGPQRMRARVAVEEWPLYRVLYGLQVSSELSLSTDQRDTRPALLTEFQRRNLFGRAITSGLAARYQSGRRIGRAFLSSPRLFGLAMQSSLIFTRSREDLFAGDSASDYFTDKTGVAFEQRFRPAKAVDVAYSYRFEHNDTLRKDGAPSEFDALDVARYNAAMSYDSRDSFSDARKGLFHSSTLEYASTRVGSDVAFAKYLMQQFAYPSLGPVTLAGAFRLGVSRGLGRNEDLIPSERFRTGGGNSVRGYAQDSLGPRDFFGDPAGGRGLLLLNGEARFPLYRWLRGVAFVDAGNVFKSAKEISLTDLAMGVGFGFRLDTPVALLRVDYGVPTVSRDGERRGRWYFSVGQIF